MDKYTRYQLQLIKINAYSSTYIKCYTGILTFIVFLLIIFYVLMLFSVYQVYLKMSIKKNLNLSLQFMGRSIELYVIFRNLDSEN